MPAKARAYGLALRPPSAATLKAVTPSVYPRPSKAAALPLSVDLRTRLPPVYDQGDLGSCTANALCCLMESLDHCPGSRLFLYYNERALEGAVAEDAGATLADGIRSLKTQGVCPEAAWPYLAAKFAERPPPACYESAVGHEALSVYSVALTLTCLKAALAAGHPVAVGLRLFASFESRSVALSGKVPMPRKGETELGGHAVVLVGFTDAAQRFLVRNSWGADWGLQGHFTLPYAYLTDPALASDAWVILAAS